jgi:trimeric autotransporter adhesin
MAITLKDRVKVSSLTTGTGTVTLGAAAAGFQNFSVIGSGNTTYYTIALQASNEWEVGIGTVTDTAGTFTLSRDTVFESSNAGSLVNFSAGTKEVFVTYPAERAVYLDSAGSAVTVLDIGTLGASTANITTANLTSGTVTTTPVNNTDIVNKAYADAIASGIHFHEAVSLATTAALPANTYNNGTSGVGATLTGNANGALSVDSTLTVVSERVLVKNESAGANNGVYTVTQVGSAGTPYILTRATDFDSVGTGVDQIDEGDFFLVTSGVANLNTAWVQQTAPPITIGTTALVFQQFSAPITYTAGTGLSESPTYTFNIANTGTAGTYGSASQVPVFVTNAQGQVTSVTNTAIGITSAAVSGLVASATTDTTNASNITAGTLPSARLNGSYTGVTGVGTLAAGTWNGSVIDAAYGGTGQSSYTTGDLLYASGATTLSKLADIATGNALLSGGVGTAPAWGKVGLTTHVSGTLPLSSGGTNATDAAGARTSLGGTTVGSNVFTLTNPSAITFPRFNADNTVSALDATDFRTAIGAGTSSTTGTVTSVTGGTYLTGGTITTSGTLAVDATSTNTASKVVARDASGNFSAGTITAALSGNATTSSSTTGNAATATALQTARTINSVSFDGTANISVNTNSALTFNNGGAGGASGSTFNGGSTLTVSYNTLGAPSTTGTGASGTWGISISGASASTTGNAATATALQTARTIGGVSFNGTANINLPGVNTAGNQNTTGTASNVSGTVAIANGGTGATTNTAARTSLGATTVGANLFTLTNPSAITFPRFNADNTVSSLDAASFRTAIGAGTGSGTVTGVTATAPVASSGGTAPVISMAAASSGVNGYMTGAYATKLDGIAAGATNVTNTNQLTNGAGFITSSGSISGNAATATTASNSNLLNSLSSTQLFNNMGQNHSTYADANSFTNFGTQYLNGTTNGPGASGTQWYMIGMGLGNDYAYSNYAMQVAIPRTPTGGNPYVSVRYREGGTWNSWAKIYAGFADTAGTITSQANSATITASTTATANQIVLRDVNGDDFRRYGFANYFNMSHGVSGATGDTVFYSSTDDYIRKNNATGFRASLNVPTRTGGDASGTWGISVTGSAGSASTSSQVTINYNNDSNANYQMLWGSGNSVYGTGGIYCNPSIDYIYASAFQATSDESLKKNWRDLPADYIEHLAGVKHGTYDRVDQELTQDGVSAQSLQLVLPNSIATGQDGKLSVNYGNAALVSAIQLAKRVVEQDARIAKLEALVAQLTKGNNP